MCEKLRSRCSRAGVKVSTLRSAFELGGTQLIDLLRSHNVPWNTESDILAAAEAVESANGTSNGESSAPSAPAQAGGPEGHLSAFNSGGIPQNGFHRHGLHRISSCAPMSDFSASLHRATPSPVPPLGFNPEALPLVDVKDEFNPDHMQIKRMHESVDRTSCMEAMPELDEMQTLQPRRTPLSSQSMMSIHADYNHVSMLPGMRVHASDRGMGSYPGSGVVCVTCGEMQNAGAFCRGMGQECAECTHLRQRGIALGLDPTTITTHVRSTGRSMFQRELAQAEAQQHLAHAQQWKQPSDGSAMPRAASVMVAGGDLECGADGVNGRKPQRGRICLVCQKLKGLTDFRVAGATALPKEICGECVRVCDAVTRVGIAWQEVRQAMVEGTLHGLLEAAGCM